MDSLIINIAGTCKHEIIILVASVSAHLVRATFVRHFFLQCSSLERASRSLAKTGLHYTLPYISQVLYMDLKRLHAAVQDFSSLCAYQDFPIEEVNICGSVFIYVCTGMYTQACVHIEVKDSQTE